MSEKGIVKERIGDSIEIEIEGIPQSILTPATQAQAAIELTRHSIPLGADLSAGVLGGVRYAHLRIDREIYKLRYSLIVLRPVVALDVFRQAIEWLELKKTRGTVDPQLVDETIEHLRRGYAEIARLTGNATTEPSPPKKVVSTRKKK